MKISVHEFKELVGLLNIDYLTPKKAQNPPDFPQITPMSQEQEKELLENLNEMCKYKGVVVGIKNEEVKDCFIRQQTGQINLGVRVDMKYTEPATTANGNTINDKAIIEAKDYLFYVTCKKGLSTSDLKKAIAEEIKKCSQHHNYKVESFIIVAIFETIDISISENLELCEEVVF